MADFPFLDLKRVYAAHKDAYESAALKCLEGGWYVLGEEVKKFETSSQAIRQRVLQALPMAPMHWSLHSKPQDLSQVTRLSLCLTPPLPP